MQSNQIIKEIKSHLNHVDSEKLAFILKIATLPHSVAIPKDKQGVADVEEKNIVVTFESYKQQMCQLGSIDDLLAKKLTDNLTKLTSSPASKIRNILTITPVYNDNEYKRLYSGLSDQVELEEIHYDTGPGRIFGHFAQNYFSVIAITTQTHLNTA